MAMPSKNELRVGVKFDVDNKQLEASRQTLTSLTKTLQEIQTQAKIADLTGNADQKLKAAAAEAKRLEEILKSSWNHKLGQLDLTKFNTALKQSGKTVQQIKTDLGQAGDIGNRAFNNVASSVLNTNVELRKTSTLLEKMSLTMANTIRFGISSSVFNNLTGSIQKAYGYAKDLDKSLNDIRIVSGLSADEMDRFAKQANAAAKSLGTSTLDYTDASLIYYQQGLSTDEVIERTDVTIKAANALGASAEDVSQYMTAIWNNFDDGSKSLEYYADVITALGASTASSAEEIAEGLEKFAAIGETVGLSYEYATSALATVTAETRQSADTVGTAFKTLFARIQDLELGDEGAVTIGKYSQALEKFDIHVLDTNGNVKKMDDILNEMGAKWQTMTDAQRVALAQNVAGTRQYTQLMALMENWGTFQKNLNTAMSSTGTLQKQQDTYLESMEAHLQKIETEAERTYDILFDTKTVNSFADSLSGLLGIFNNFLEGLGGGTNALMFFGATAASVMNKQIGASLERQIENFEIMKKQMAGEQLKPDFVQAVGDIYSLQGEDISAAGVQAKVQAEADIAEKLYNIRKNLTNEEYQELVVKQQQIGKDTERIYNAEHYLDLVKDISEVTEVSEETFSTDIKEVKEEIAAITEEYEERRDILEELGSLVQKVESSRGDPKTLDEVNAKLVAMANDLKYIGLSTQEIDALQKDINHTEEDRVAAWDIIESKAKEINPVLEEQYVKLDKITEAEKQRKFLQSDEYEAALRQKQRQEEEIAATAAKKQREEALSTLSLTLTTGLQLYSLTKGFVTTLGELRQGTISVGDAIEKILPMALTSIPIIISGISKINAGLPNLVARLGLVKAAEDGVAVSAGTAWAAMLGPLALIIASIGILAFDIQYLIKEYNKTADAAKEAAVQVSLLDTALIECTKAADELEQAITQYDEAANQLTNLTNGTAEYTKALKEANKQAESLISNYKLLSGVDYRIDENGLITFDMSSGNSLERKQTELENKNKQIQNAQIALSNRALMSQRASDKLNLQRSQGLLGIDYNSEKELQYRMMETGLSTINPLLGLGGQIAHWTNEDRGYRLTSAQIENITEELLKNGDYASILSKSTEDFEQWIKNNDKLSQNVKDNAYWFAQSKSALLEWVTAADKTKDALEENYKEMAKTQIETSTELSNSIANIARDSEGNINEGIQTLITNALLASSSGQIYTGGIKSANLTAQSQSENAKTLGGFEDFAKKLYGESIAAQMGLTGLDDVKSAKAYLKYVQGYTDEDLAHMRITDNWGDTTTATWDMDYTDSKGVLHKATDTIYQEVSDEMLRSTTAYTLSVEKAQKELDEENLKLTTEAIKKMMDSTSKLSQEYGINFSNIILNSMAGRVGNENAALDFTGLFDKLTDEQINTLIGLNQDDLARALGLTEEDFIELGYDSAKAFETAFDEGLFANEKQALERLNTILQSEIGGNLSNQQLGNILGRVSADMSADQINTLAQNPLALSQIDFTSTDYGKISEQLIYMSDCMKKVSKDSIVLTDAQKEQAKELKYSEKALQSYAKELMQNREGLKDNEQAAVNLALRTIQMNKGIETLASGFEKWNKVLQDGLDKETKTSEYFEVLSELKDAMTDIFGVEVSDSFLEAEDNLEKIGQLAEGDIEVFDDLQQAAMIDYVTNLNIIGPDDSTVDGIRNQILDMVEDVQSRSDIEITAELDTGYVDQLNQMLANGAITVDQMNSILRGIGYEPTVQYRSVLGPETATVHRVAMKNPLTGGEITLGEVTDYSRSTVQVPYIEGGSSGEGSGKSGPQYVGTPRSADINYSNTAAGRKSSGGGGSSKEPNTMDPLQEEADRYHEINTQITKVDNNLKKVQSQTEKLVGTKLIENLNKQWELLNTQITNYNKKLEIARQEQSELRNSLAGKGVKFNADDTIANYMEVFAAQQNYVNSLIDAYNGMSAEEQEAYKDTVEQAKDDFKEFQEDLDRYDELVSDQIPGLTQSIQDTLDQQIEINIKKFNMEVDLTLNIADAEREWNAWKAKVLDEIKESDILGNAKARLEDFSSYYDSAAAGAIQVQSRHLEDTLAELKKMDKGLENIYGDNRSQALEDLQKYYKQLMEDLEGVLDLQNEIHQAYLNMMDEAQNKFKQQLDTYSMIGELLENNMKVVQLIYGENAYNQLSNYYQQQYDNNAAQLDFLRQQKQLWADQMELFEEGSDEWESAKEKWMDAAKELSSALSDALDKARQAFENTIKEIFQDLNNLVTDNLGLDYVKEEWDLINKNADEYLDTINTVAGIRELETKYIDAINQSNNSRNQQKLNALMDSELNTLRSMDKLSQADLDRANLKYQIALAQLALEEAQENKTQMRLRRDSQGNYRYQYTADEAAIEKAKEELSGLYVDLYNFDRDKYKENLNQIYSTWEEYQNKMAEAALINDPELRAERELLIQEQYSELINGLLEKNSNYRTELQESSFMTLSQQYQDDLLRFTDYTQNERNMLLNEVGGAFDSLLEVYGINAEAFRNMTLDEQNAIVDNIGEAFVRLTGFYNEDIENFNNLADANKDILVNKMVPQWVSAVQTMADKISGEGGLEATTEKSMRKIQEATAEYDKQVEILAQTAEKTTVEIGKGLDSDIDKTRELVKDNGELIGAYENELKAVKNVCDQIDSLIEKYGNAETAAKRATEAAYKYWLQEQEKNAAEAKKQNQTSSESGNTGSTNAGSSSSSGTAAVAAQTSSSPQGNGSVDLGDQVTLEGKLASSSGRAPTLTPVSRYRGAQLYVQMINEGSRSPYHLGTSPNYSSSTAVGWVDEDQITGYDTGGYTGSWNNTGKLAFLHQKELVLNAQDTENMLNTVAIMRNLATTLGENLLARLAGVSAKGNRNMDSSEVFEQNVHIDATFPGVKDAKEIEDALNNLVNSASQRAFMKR